MSAQTFLLPCGERSLLFAPLRDLAALLSRRDHEDLVRPGGPPPRLQALWERLRHRVEPPSERRGPLQPRFLGLITTRDCSLACRYCDFQPGQRGETLTPALVKAGIALMGELAQNQGAELLPVHFFGGEPLLAWDLVQLAVARARAEAERRGLSAYFEVTTNGLLSREKAVWIGDNLHKVVLSLDGPPPVQDRQRPRKDGGASSAQVETCARLLSDAGAELCLRLCVTAETVSQLEEIVEYCLTQFRPTEIAVEPMQEGAGRREGWRPPVPWDFVRHLARAYDICEEYGVELIFSATQIDRPGLSLCPVGNDGLILHPQGRLAACYLPPEEWRRQGLELEYGVIDAEGRWSIDATALQGVRASNVLHYPRCDHCFCRWYCSGGCHVHHSPPGGRRGRDDFCVMTRAISYWQLLRRVGAEAEAAAFLDHPEADLKEWVLMLGED